MEFEKTSPNWQASGVEPPTTLKQDGFTAGYKPPAAYFNWLFTRLSDCITELQTAISTVDSNAVGEKIPNGGERFNSIMNSASGILSHAEGYFTEAYGLYSHAENDETTASGESSHAENVETVASGKGSHAQGINTIAKGYGSHSGGVGTIANDYQTVIGRYNRETQGLQSDTDVSSDSTVFSAGVGTSQSDRGNAFRIRADGKCCGTSSFLASGADYAELAEWVDGNPNNEDRRGLFVTFDGDKIQKANEGDYIAGVVSANPCFIGNTQSEEWVGKYMLDVFGERIKQTVVIPEKTDEKTGEVIPQHTEEQFVINPDYDPTKEYVPREKRPEYSPICFVGVIVVVDDGTCQVNGYCKPTNGGIATTSETGYRVLKRLDGNHIKIHYRG